MAESQKPDRRKPEPKRRKPHRSPLPASRKPLQGEVLEASAKVWHVYILRCRDDTLYTGITTDIERRLDEHNRLQSGASYTRGRRPVSLVYSTTAADRKSASSREWQIKQLSRAAKESLIESQRSPSQLNG